MKRSVLFFIAVRHVLARPRQSLVSTLGIVLGVGFFLAIAGLMQGSQSDFIRRLVDTSPHITISDQFRQPHMQPVETMFAGGAIDLRSAKPATEPRGIRGYERILETVRAIPGARATPVLTGQAIVNGAGGNVGLVLNGMIPSQMRGITTVADHMVAGSVDDLSAATNGIIIGDALAKRLGASLGSTMSLSAGDGRSHFLRIVGLFHAGNTAYDEGQGFVSLRRAQALLDRPNRVNTVIVKLADPYQAQQVAAVLEKNSGYKSVSWQEATEDLMASLAIRNVIVYAVVGAVLVVAAFGIYNVISTIVLEKRRDIAILKSMGFLARDIQWIFLCEGVLVGLVGSLAGVLLGTLLMLALGNVTFRYPGSTEPYPLPVDWGAAGFLIAVSFAMLASALAALLPARKAATVNPADVLRGS
jgi:lipoprotein-releasing system permease protein